MSDDAITWARGVMEARTPGEWVLAVEHDEEDHDHVIAPSGEIVRVEYGEVDADGFGVDGPSAGDARAITLAVNTHAALIDVLEAARKTPHECTLARDDGDCALCNAIGMGLDALRAEMERR